MPSPPLHIAASPPLGKTHSQHINDSQSIPGDN